MSQYQIIHITEVDGAARLSSLQNVNETFRFSRGMSYKADYPDNALFHMRENRPKNVKLVDALFNTSSLLVVSTRFKELLESVPRALDWNEVLPVSIVNHKGRTEKAPYFIVHQLDNPACLDEAQSTGTRSKLAPEKFQFLDSMVLDPALVPEDRQLFRIAQYPTVVMIRRDLADKLSEAELVGVEFRDIDGYEFL